ncbi:GntR family transcriptional regulator [Microbispora sp. ATCC PTA-5024]|uniref:GntR family transcriptional regulator n=1 Tax=Microbispora sp. ATCC PTA-5024 TaxID=316330 RepID=UPI0003DD1EE2|nr:GntR family transcriptional regulator [Microbispora sp. ATCC PTA-5024]ETK37215.1 hypothetical protein MPTA5024_05015 [Microbispora sp. ATCC PTA-5024]
MANEPDEPDPAYRRLAAALRQEILHGRIEPDCPLPPEETLVEEHGLRPEDVRRAVDVLSGEGLVYLGDDGRAHVSTRAEETGGG